MCVWWCCVFVVFFFVKSLSPFVFKFTIVSVCFSAISSSSSYTSSKCLCSSSAGSLTKLQSTYKTFSGLLFGSNAPGMRQHLTVCLALVFCLCPKNFALDRSLAQGCSFLTALDFFGNLVSSCFLLPVEELDDFAASSVCFLNLLETEACFCISFIRHLLLGLCFSFFVQRSPPCQSSILMYFVLAVPHP